MSQSSSPKPSSESARNRMRAVRHQGTAPEVALRAALDSLGLDYNVDTRPEKNLRTRADVVFMNEKVAVFVDGCFWHGCPIHGTQAKANVEFWRAKIQRNQERDCETNRALEESGWAVIRVWEHEDMTITAKAIAAILKDRKPAE